MSTFFKPLAWALPIVMLLAGCNGSDKDADKDATKPEPHTTYKKADFFIDLQIAFLIINLILIYKFC